MDYNRTIRSKEPLPRGKRVTFAREFDTFVGARKEASARVDNNVKDQVERIFREVRAFRIYDGPSEVHRWSLAQRIARQGPNW